MITAGSATELGQASACEGSTAGGTAGVGLVFYPIIETFLMKLVAAVQFCYDCSGVQNIEAEAAMAAFSVCDRGLIAGKFEYFHLSESFKFGFQGKPIEGIGWLSSFVDVAIVDKQVIEYIFEEKEED